MSWIRDAALSVLVKGVAATSQNPNLPSDSLQVLEVDVPSKTSKHAARERMSQPQFRNIASYCIRHQLSLLDRITLHRLSFDDDTYKFRHCTTHPFCVPILEMEEACNCLCPSRRVSFPYLVLWIWESQTHWLCTLQTSCSPFWLPWAPASKPFQTSTSQTSRMSMIFIGDLGLQDLPPIVHKYHLRQCVKDIANWQLY